MVVNPVSGGIDKSKFIKATKSFAVQKNDNLFSILLRELMIFQKHKNCT